MCSDGVLADRSGELVVKPCKQAEIDFYQTTSAHHDFAYFIPTFVGTLALSQDVGEAASELVSSAKLLSSGSSLPHATLTGATTQSWIASSKRITTDCAIVLENVAAGLRKPNTLDVKLGARLWADDAIPDKREKLDKVASQTTSAPLGFRIAGMKTWMGLDSAGKNDVALDGYKKFDKEYGRSFTVDTVQTGFEEFFFVESAGITRKLGRKVIRRFLEDLRELQHVLEGEESRMYSASLLFVYEGGGPELQEDFEAEKHMLAANGSLGTIASEDVAEVTADEESSEEDKPHFPKIQAVKMIDFAHAAWTPGQGPDENALHGIRNVIKILEDLSK